MLAPKVKSNLEVVLKSDDPNVVVEAIVSSVVIANVFHRHHIDLKVGLLTELLRSLQIPPNCAVSGALVQKICQLEDHDKRWAFRFSCINYFKNINELIKYGVLLLNWKHLQWVFTKLQWFINIFIPAYVISITVTLQIFYEAVPSLATKR